MSLIRVLIVDDSAFARKVLRESLTASGQIEVVGIARDGIDALEKIAQLDPEIITLDLVMPSLDGVGVLSALTPAQRRRVVVVSMADGESESGVAALALGAFDLVHKPTSLAVDSLRDIAADLVRAVVLAAGSQPLKEPAVAPTPLPRAPTSATSDRVVLLGTSTGGPQALARVLKAFPADFPASVLIVLHIPPGYTGPLAARFNAECAIEVVEASEGLLLRPGLAVIAMAGLHLRLVSHAGSESLHLDAEPSDSAHRPSVDVLFESAAEVLGRRALAVVMTGMGDDGLRGARAIKAAGGEVLTEAESSCVVYGMPRVVKEAGLSSAEAPLSQIASEIMRRL